jgi:hypothetical protein
LGRVLNSEPPAAGPPLLDGSGTLRPWARKHLARFSRACCAVAEFADPAAVDDDELEEDPQALSPTASATMTARLATGMRRLRP